MNSSRKDVEDFFGILKGRFRILKLPNQFHSKKKIDNVFFSCVALHNMIHVFDGRDVWESTDVDYSGVDGLFHDEEDAHWKRPKVRREGNTWEYVTPDEDHSTVGSFHFSDTQAPSGVAGPTLGPVDISRLVDLQTETDEKFRALQAKLVTNYRLRRARDGPLPWLRSNSNSIST